MEEEIKSAQEEVNNNSEIYNKTKQEYSTNKDMYSTKIREWRSVQNRVKRLEDDISTLCKEIHRLEGLENIILFFTFMQCQFYITLLYIIFIFSGDNAEQSERNEIKQQLAELEQKLDETEALLRTNQTCQMHLETDKMRLLKEIQASKIEINNCEKRIGKSRIICKLIVFIMLLINSYRSTRYKTKAVFFFFLRKNQVGFKCKEKRF